MSSVMDFEIHDHPYDYWRFTPKTFESLLQNFQDSYVTYAGRAIFPHTVVGIARKNDLIPDKTELDKAFGKWRNISKIKQ